MIYPASSFLPPSSDGFLPVPHAGEEPQAAHDHALLSAIVNASEDAILSKTLDGIITSWNPAAERMFGYTAQEIIGQSNTILFPPDRLPEEEAILDRLKRGIPTDHFETVRLHKDGTLLHVSVSISPIRDSKGHVIGASTIARDITQRKMAEIAQREQEQFVSTVLDTVGALVIVLDMEGRILRFNLACERITEWTFAEVEGKPFWDMLLLPEEAAGVRDAFAQLCAGDFPLHYENHWLTKHGDRRYIAFSNTALLNEDGSIQAIIGTGLDMTEQRTAEAATRNSEARYRAVVELCPDALIVHRDFVLLFANPAALRLFGATDAAQVLGTNLLDFVHPDTRALARQRVQSLQTTQQETPAMEQRWVDLHGQPLDVEIRGTACDWQGQRAVQVIIRDIRERKQAEAHLRQSEERFRQSFEDASIGMNIADMNGKGLAVNEAFARMVGYTSDELLGISYSSITHSDDVAPFLQWLLAVKEQGCRKPFRQTKRYVHKDGHLVWGILNVAVTCDEENQPLLLLGQIQDVTEAKQYEQQLQTANEWQKDAIEQLTLQQKALSDANAHLEALATTDGLTGLKNHRALHERLREESDHANRYNTPLSALMLDVDKFKVYNDTFGHPAGDTVLRQVARILQETARTCDIVARYGGEEFAVLLPGADVEEAKTVAERLRQAIETATWPERTITVSIGVATLAPATPHPDALLVNADAALYRSKHRGRNCVTHATAPMEADELDIEATRWYDDLLHKLLAAQAETLGLTTEQVRETLLAAYETTIESWSRILNLKDKETEGHSERVTQMLERLARRLGFNEQEVLFARWGACLHDIGKMAVPDHILHKPGPLTDEEWILMKQHTTVAYEMLQRIEFLEPAIDIPYCHHEKWDGSGYPRGLKGEEIPLMARLFAVVDVYDALTSDRPYRKAWTEEKVRAYLREQAGTHFDPQAVDAFLNMLQEECVTPHAV